MTEAQEKFLRLAAARLPLERVVEVHLFPPIRNGGLETGIAVVAVALEEPAAEAIALPDDASVSAGDVDPSALACDPTEDAAGPAPRGHDDGIARGRETGVGITAPDAAGVDEVPDAVVGGVPGAEADEAYRTASDEAPREAPGEALDVVPDAAPGEAADAGGPPRNTMSPRAAAGASPDERTPARDDASLRAPGAPLAPSAGLPGSPGAALLPDADDPLGIPEPAEPIDADDAAVAPRPVPRRHTVYTARYRSTLKGPERGRFEVEVQAEADAPLVTIDAVVRGVQKRANEPAEAERLPGDALRALVARAGGGAGNAASGSPGRAA